MVQPMIDNGVCDDIKDGDLHPHIDNTLFQSSNEIEEFQLSHNKRIKLSHELKPQGDSEDQKVSAIGLKLSKTPSFTNLVEQKLPNPTYSPPITNLVEQKLPKPKYAPQNNQCCTQMLDNFVSQQKPTNGKLKAANFGASKLKIGTWERISKREGHLVTKCYYAKKKLVWEILEGALKSKIEIQWLDIVGIRATIGKNEIGILELELKQPPLFFEEIDPQPKKHTLWQQASDFTDGQASICRIHKATFPRGVLFKHYGNILQFDERLFLLSKKPFPTEKFPYFNQKTSSPTTFSFDFSNRRGPKFLPQYPIPSYVNTPTSVHHYVPNISPQTSSPLVNIGPNTLSGQCIVTDYSRGNNPSLENQKMKFSSQKLVPNIEVQDSNIQATQLLPCPSYYQDNCVDDYGDSISSNSNNEILSGISEIKKQDGPQLYTYCKEVETCNYSNTNVIEQSQAASKNYSGMNIMHLEAAPQTNYIYQGTSTQQLEPNPCNYYNDVSNIQHSEANPSSVTVYQGTDTQKLEPNPCIYYNDGLVIQHSETNPPTSNPIYQGTSTQLLEPNSCNYGSYIQHPELNRPTSTFVYQVTGTQQLEPNPCNYYNGVGIIPHLHAQPISWFEPQDSDEHTPTINVHNKSMEVFPDYDDTLDVSIWDTSF